MTIRSRSQTIWSSQSQHFSSFPFFSFFSFFYFFSFLSPVFSQLIMSPLSYHSVPNPSRQPLSHSRSASVSTLTSPSSATTPTKAVSCDASLGRYPSNSIIFTDNRHEYNPKSPLLELCATHLSRPCCKNRTVPLTRGQTAWHKTPLRLTLGSRAGRTTPPFKRPQVN
jgi:hypothetical protein